MVMIIHLSFDGDNWPPALFNFCASVNLQPGVTGFNATLMAQDVNATLTYRTPIMGQLRTDTGYDLTFVSMEDYVEFMLKWS